MFCTDKKIRVHVIFFNTGNGCSRFQIPAKANGSSLFQNVQTSSGAHPASYSIDNGGFIPGVKRADREIYCSPLCSAEARNEWSNTSTSLLSPDTSPLGLQD